MSVKPEIPRSNRRLLFWPVSVPVVGAAALASAQGAKPVSAVRAPYRQVLLHTEMPFVEIADKDSPSALVAGDDARDGKPAPQIHDIHFSQDFLAPQDNRDLMAERWADEFPDLRERKPALAHRDPGGVSAARISPATGRPRLSSGRNRTLPRHAPIP